MAKILHFTDMHLRHNLPETAKQPVPLSREMPSALDRLSHTIKEIVPDVVVLSGDLLDVQDEVIAGHYHPGNLETTRGIIHSLPPAFCEAPHAFRIYAFIEGRRTTASDYTRD